MKFEISEIKNFIVYSILTIAALYKSLRSYYSLKHKYRYADLLARDYLPSLKLKMTIMILHLVTVVSFTCLYIVSVVLQKTYFIKYSSPVLSLVNSNTLEVLTTIFYIWVFRSRRFPFFYNVDYAINDNEKGKIYTCKLPSIKSLCDSGIIKSLGKKKMKENQNCPFIVVNPVFVDDSSNLGGINRSSSIDTISYINMTINDTLIAIPCEK